MERQVRARKEKNERFFFRAFEEVFSQSLRNGQPCLDNETHLHISFLIHHFTWGFNFRITISNFLERVQPLHSLRQLVLFILMLKLLHYLTVVVYCRC
jgi:hypothetical protein